MNLGNLGNWTFCNGEFCLLTCSFLMNLYFCDHCDIENEISNLDSTKTRTINGIPTKRLKDASDICSEYLLKIWNNEIVENGYFPDKIKLVDVTPIFKKDNATQANYVQLLG